MVYIDIFNKNNIFNKGSIIGEIKDKSIYISIKNDFEDIKQFIEDIYKMVYKLKMEIRNISIKEIYNILLYINSRADYIGYPIDRILFLIEKIPPNKNIEAFKQYLKWIKSEISDKLYYGINEFIEYIRDEDEYGLDPFFKQDLIKFLNNFDGILEEIKNTLNKISQYL